MSQFPQNLSQWFFTKNPRVAQNRTIALFLTVVAIPLGLTFYFSRTFHINLQVSISNISTLSNIYEEYGIDGFLQAKDELKQQVKANIQNPVNDEEQLAAIGIATYLFPEALPDTNFEKQTAKELWVPMQKAIEKYPGTTESRIWFEEMRMNIWNYESPSSANPELSSYAREMLRIYNKMTLK